MAMAVTVPVTNGTVEMDGHRPEFYVHYGMKGAQPIAQMRVTSEGGEIVELALTRGQIRDILDMLELYR